jgi:hypothetical protein
MEAKDMNNDIIAAAYACMISHPTDITLLARCMSAQVPVMMATDPYREAEYGNAFIFSQWNEKEISQHMILLYKDESYRGEIINQACQLLEERSWPYIVKMICNSMLIPALA